MDACLSDRFSPTAKQSRNPYAFMSFGHGPHSCIGMRFAMMQMKLASTRILNIYGCMKFLRHKIEFW